MTALYIHPRKTRRRRSHARPVERPVLQLPVAAPADGARDSIREEGAEDVDAAEKADKVERGVAVIDFYL